MMDRFFGMVELTRSEGHNLGAMVGRTVGEEVGRGVESSWVSDVYSVGLKTWVMAGGDPPCCGADPPCSTGMWIVSMMGGGVLLCGGTSVSESSSESESESESES